MKLSIVIPTYNRAALLPRAIESVLAQTYTDFELIIVDDASTDDTESVVRTFTSPAISYLRFDVNKGVSAARNAGAMRATGDWVAFLDSDDAYLPQATEIIVTEAQNVSDSVGMLFFPIELYKDGGPYIGKRGYLPDSDWDYYTPTYEELLMKKGVKNDMHRVYRTSVLKRFPFDEKIKDHDTILYAELARRGVKCLYVNKSVVNVYIGREDHLSYRKRDPRAWYYIYSLYFRDHKDALRTSPTVYSAMCIGMALCCFRLGKPSAIVWLARGLSANPTSLFRMMRRKRAQAEEAL